jgi:hypothetical protein
MHRVSTTKHVNKRAVADITWTADLPGWYCSVYSKCGGGFPAVKTSLWQPPFQILAQSLAVVLPGNKVKEWKKQQQEKGVRWNS